MALNKYYTKEEIKRLRILMKDYPDETPKYIAKKAIDLGVCTDRTVSAVARQVNKLKNMPLYPPKTKVVVVDAKTKDVLTPDALTHVDDAWITDRDLYVTSKLYEDLLKTIFDNATLWAGDYEDGLFFNIPSLRAWLKEYEPRRFDMRLTELLDNKYIHGKA